MTATEERVDAGDDAGGGDATSRAPRRSPVPRLRRAWHRLRHDPHTHQWMVALVPVAIVLAMAWQRRWMADDGFIHLRVVDQVVNGNGPVFNAGERVEASTSPLWMCLLTVLSFVGGLGLPWKAVFAGMLLTAIGMVAAQRAALVLTRAAGDDRRVWPLGTAAVAALPPFWDYTTSGLETGMSFAWIGGCCWWVAVRATCATPPRRRTELAGAVLVSLGYTIRPDLALFSLAFGSVLVAARWQAGWRARVGLVAALGAIPVANQIFRMGYYGMLVPNTAVAKEASVAQWGSGWKYLTDLFLPYALWLPVGLALVLVAMQVAGDRDRGARLAVAARLAPVVAALVHLLYITRVGGDFMHARLLLPAVFALLAPVGLTITPARTDARTRRLELIVVTTATWLVLSTFLLRPTLTGPAGGNSVRWFTTGNTIEDERVVYQWSTRMDHPIRADVHAQWVAMRRDEEPEDGRLVGIAVREGFERIDVPLAEDHRARAAGWFAPPAFSWSTDVYIVDIGVLAHPIGSRLDHLIGNRMGHQKRIGLAWQFAGMTYDPVIRNEDGDLLVSGAEMDAADRALTCGALADYLDDIREPLTPGRFLGNILDSFGNTSMRVPTNPADAERKFCGDNGVAGRDDR
jgi:arabinofuranosyltransferase